MSSVAVSLDFIKQNLRQNLSLKSASRAEHNSRFGRHLLSEAQHFTDYFEVKLAATPAQQDQVFRLRGDVYCKEFRYESEENCPNGLEHDDYDAQSIHCLIVHREQQLAAGCVRLVLPNSSKPFDPLPMERYCGASLSHPVLHPTLLLRQHVTEVSRLAVHTVFRRRAGEYHTPHGIALPDHPNHDTFDEAERRTFPLIATVLVLAATALSKLTGRQNNFAMMEPRLARLLQRLGLDFVQVGDMLDYHGQRAAFHIGTEEAISGMKGDLKGLYQIVYHDLARGFKTTRYSKQKAC